MKELEIKNYTLPNIEINDYENLKIKVEEDNEKYKNYIVTKESLESDIKKRAELNKIVKAIDDRRKEIKNEISLPIKEFEEKCNILRDLYKQSSENIDIQIKKFENEEKDKKKKEIEIIFKDKNNIEKLTFENIFDEKWLNKTIKIENIEKEIISRLKEINDDLETIKKLDSEFEIELINEYFKSFDLKLIINKNQELIELKKEKEEVKQKLEEKSKEIKQEFKKTETRIIKYTLEIEGEYNSLIKLKEFMEKENIKFRKVN